MSDPVIRTADEKTPGQCNGDCQKCRDEQTAEQAAKELAESIFTEDVLARLFGEKP